MRKKILGFTAAAFVLTMSTGITAFAGSWKEDAIGRYYENDDGSRPVYAGWFTDPADGAVYAMDPDGYTMPNSNMGSFRTDDMGRRIDKTEEDLKRENERKAELAPALQKSRPLLTSLPMPLLPEPPALLPELSVPPSRQRWKPL